MTPSPQAHAELREKATKALAEDKADSETFYARAAFEASLEPPAILALLDELDSEKKFSSQLIEWLNTAHIKLDAANVRIAALEAQVAAVNAILAEGCEGSCDYGSCAECDCSNDEPCNINGDEDKFCLRCLIQARMKAAVDEALTRYPQGAARVK